MIRMEVFHVSWQAFCLPCVQKFQVNESVVRVFQAARLLHQYNLWRQPRTDWQIYPCTPAPFACAFQQDFQLRPITWCWQQNRASLGFAFIKTRAGHGASFWNGISNIKR